VDRRSLLADPFLRPDGGPDPVAEGRLLWEQLLGIRTWHDFARALQTLSIEDLRHVVFLKIYEEYGNRRAERNGQSSS
jgi:hypothetical protein